jgi:hypothetical protein
MSTSCSRSERGSSSSSLWVLLCRGMMGMGMVVKGNDSGRWSSDVVVLWLGRRQNGDMVEWWGEWLRLRWPFYSSERWELGSPEMVVGDGGVDSILRFRLERGSNETKCCRKMKRRQRAHRASLGRKCDTARRHGNIGQRRGGTREGKGRRRC